MICHIIDKQVDNIIKEGDIITPIYIVEITIYQPGTPKLTLLKYIKDITGFGLKESKEIIDDLINCPQRIIISLRKSEINEIKERLLSLDGCIFDITDQQKIRDSKLKQLGLYNKEELIDEVIELDLLSIFSMEGCGQVITKLTNHNIEFIKNILKLRYKSIPEKELLEIISKNKYESTL